MSTWTIKVGTWVTILPLDTPGVDWADWKGDDPAEPQPGHTYQVDTMDIPDLVSLAGCPSEAYVSWLQPATPEEIAAAQLTACPAGL